MGSYEYPDALLDVYKQVIEAVGKFSSEKLTEVTTQTIIKIAKNSFKV